jgi:hypothetical protein
VFFLRMFAYYLQSMSDSPLPCQIRLFCQCILDLLKDIIISFKIIQQLVCNFLNFKNQIDTHTHIYIYIYITTKMDVLFKSYHYQDRVKIIESKSL